MASVTGQFLDEFFFHQSFLSRGPPIGNNSFNLLLDCYHPLKWCFLYLVAFIRIWGTTTTYARKSKYFIQLLLVECKISKQDDKVIL